LYTKPNIIFEIFVTILRQLTAPIKLGYVHKWAVYVQHSTEARSCNHCGRQLSNL